MQFDTILPSVNEIAAVGDDPNFNEDGEYIDNKENGAEVAEISSPLINPDQIGNEGESVDGPKTCINTNSIK